MLHRLRNWFLIGALIVCAVLFVGLVHDFTLQDRAAAWFTSRPAIPLTLLVIGYLFMVGQRFANRGEDD